MLLYTAVALHLAEMMAPPHLPYTGGGNVNTPLDGALVGGFFCFMFIGFPMTCLALFFALEFRKKFHFMRWVAENTRNLVEYQYDGLAMSKIVKDTGMRNIVLRDAHRTPFIALVGFRLEVPILNWVGYDYYGVVRSDKSGVAVISTYFGRGPVTFQFIVLPPLHGEDTVDGIDVVVSSTDEDQKLTAHPDNTFPPHFYQEKLGFYG